MDIFVVICSYSTDPLSLVSFTYATPLCADLIYFKAIQPNHRAVYRFITAL